MSAPKGGGLAAINKGTGLPNGWHVYKDFQPPATGWRYSRETLAKLDSEGRVYFPTHKDGTPDTSKRLALKRYLNEQKGNIITNVWTDILLRSKAASRWAIQLKSQLHSWSGSSPQPPRRGRSSLTLSVKQPTKAMRAEATDAGFYEYAGKQYPRLQFLTVADVLEGKRELDTPTKMNTTTRINTGQTSLPL